MAFPVIVFNADTGSDTAASGAGPATAITGTAAAHTGGAASTTITLTGSPDLSGVATDGSAVFWGKTASGRQFSKITGADNVAKTVAVEDQYTIAEASAVNYAIGGKRATWNNADSRNLRSDLKPGWTVETETAQTLDAIISGNCSGDTTNGVITWRGSAGSPKVVLQTINNYTFLSTGTGNPTLWKFENLHFQNSATGTTRTAVNMNGGTWFYKNCIFGDTTNSLYTALYRGGSGFVAYLDGCEFKNIWMYCIYIATSAWVFMRNCSFHDHANNPVIGCFGSDVILEAYGCSFYDNLGTVIHTNSHTPTWIVQNCVFYNNGGSAIFGGSVGYSRRSIKNNIFMNGGAYGIALPSDSIHIMDAILNNCYYNNTSGPYVGYPGSSGDILADPLFVDAANGDFRLQATSPCINAGYPNGDIGFQRAQGTIPAVANVRSGTSYNVGGQDGTLVGTYDPVTGNYTDPGKANVVVGHDYTFAGAAQVAEFDESARNTDPGEANVVAGVGYKIQNVSKTGALAGGGGGGSVVGSPIIRGIGALP